ncbi:hypothetical protein [Achromobacter insuavis]|uniref:hypothetical protein n=1 Tax=Achromobacter insuavis TaxID=1287735 RepID=UPI001F13C029|nr:hypothetical protein [Achromobacter insuavis]
MERTTPAFTEDQLVKEAEVRLRNFFTARSRKFLSYTPENTSQNFYQLDQYCADLVACVDDWYPLLLEFKLFDGKYLPSFKKTQHEGLMLLNEHGVPVRYCFNRTPHMAVADDAEFLDALLTCEAKPLPSRTPVTTHSSLLNLLTKQEHGDHKLAPLAFCYSGVFEKAQVAELNTARLLILADTSVLSLPAQYGKQLVDRIWANQQKSGRKLGKVLQELQSEIIRLRMSYSELVAEFQAIEQRDRQELGEAFGSIDEMDPRSDEPPSYPSPGM